MELNILNIKGEETGKKVQLNDAIFGIEPNDHAIYLDVKQFMANNRQGTHKSKQRSEIAGSTRKLGRQKGGGGARPGDIKSPVRVGGGRIFGPVPRDYSFKLNKKVKQLARKSALSLRAQNGQIIALDALKFEAPKTKDFVAMMSALKIADKKALFVLPVADDYALLSARNLQNVNLITVNELNTYAIMNSTAVVVLPETLAALDETFKA
ncbi:MAG: 50S ribosomal protein L4 [Paludibacteraceae bacterium]|jgi:large subunit ribosomal protein L4|nr:50S ribosomal protein L4 [Paludibacteraceae bacterium]MBR4548262.1 50S ribosomal protein L4 [Paludibacteraceae bacterium]